MRRKKKKKKRSMKGEEELKNEIADATEKCIAAAADNEKKKTYK